MRTHTVFLTGSTGYLGSRTAPLLLQRGHRVRALVRSASRHKAPTGCDLVIGDPLDRASFSHAIAPADTVVQLVGVPHPSPAKARQFVDIDLRSAREAVAAAQASGIAHVVYVSVAQPAPVMKAYQAARRAAEDTLSASGLPHTILRPFYVLGPGHRWPTALLPIYWTLERLAPTRESARRLGLVTVGQMVTAIVDAVEHPPVLSRIVDVPAIRACRLTD